MKGLVVDPTGRVIEMPIIGNYKHGLSALGYFVGARGARGRSIRDANRRPLELVDARDRLKTILAGHGFQTAAGGSDVGITLQPGQPHRLLLRNYRWYLDHVDDFKGSSGISHRVPWKQGILAVAKWFF